MDRMFDYKLCDNVIYHVITWTEYFLSREKLNAVCDRNASQNNPNLSVWEHKTVNLYKILLLALDTLGLVVSTQPKVDLCLIHHTHIYCIMNIIIQINCYVSNDNVFVSLILRKK